MHIHFYKNFTKKANSTKVPGDDVPQVSLNLEIYGECSMFSPRFRLSHDSMQEGYTYAYIPDWHRYYFCTGYDYTSPYVIINMEVDLLASARAEILASSAYIVRTSTRCNPQLVDDMCITTSKAVTRTSQYTFGDWTLNYNSGSYFVGAVSKGGLAGIQYYAFTPTHFRELMNKLFASPEWMGIQDISAQLQQAMLNPADNIVTTYWVPWSVGEGTEQTISIGFWDITITCNVLTAALTGFQGEITYYRNPQADSNHLWLNNAPYTSYVFNFPPFFTGMELDAGLMARGTSVDLRFIADISTGSGRLRAAIMNGDTIIAPDIVDINCSFCVPIPLGVSSIDFSNVQSKAVIAGVAGGVTSMYNSIDARTPDKKGIFDSIFGPTVNLVKNLGGYIGDTLKGAAESALNSVYSTKQTGMMGTLVSITNQPQITTIYNEIVKPDYDLVGYPYAATAVIGSLGLGAFVKAAAVNIETPLLTVSERNEIEMALGGGIYID